LAAFGIFTAGDFQGTVAVDSRQRDARIRNRIGHCRRYPAVPLVSASLAMSGATAVRRNDVFLLNCHPRAAWIALCNARVQDGENQIVQNWLRGKENSSPAQNERRIFTEHHLEFHAGDLIGLEPALWEKSSK
jgi:hypothetical protein